jgi:hypothetical protein
MVTKRRRTFVGVPRARAQSERESEAVQLRVQLGEGSECVGMGCRKELRREGHGWKTRGRGCVHDGERGQEVREEGSG